MKKEYETPKVEKMDFDYEETVTASNGTGRTSFYGEAADCTCDWRIVDEPDPVNNICWE